MTGVPPPALYHRWLGWHAPAMLAMVGGWNASALAFLLATWAIIIRADSSRAPQLAARKDQTMGCHISPWRQEPFGETMQSGARGRWGGVGSTPGEEFS